MTFRNPPTAVDVIIEVYDKKFDEQGNDILHGIVLIKRKNDPFKGSWAIPGGFQEIGETLEQTAIREMKEETGLDIIILDQLRVYSNPDRDPRGHVNSIGFVAKAYEIPRSGDDAAEAAVFPIEMMPKMYSSLAFDHKERLEEYLKWRQHS